MGAARCGVSGRRRCGCRDHHRRLVMETERGLLDTSVFIAQETGRHLGTLPALAAISAVTIAELHLGVLMADDVRVRAQRSRTLTAVEAAFEVLSADAEVAHVFAQIVAEARR